MKVLIITFSLLFSAWSLAAPSMLNVSPDRPIVIQADRTIITGPEVRYIHAPWFQAHYSISNTTANSITVTGLQFTAISIEHGVVSYVITLDAAEELAPGELFQIQNLYLDSLPESNFFEYPVTASLLGWTGPINYPKEALTDSFTFITR